MKMLKIFSKFPSIINFEMLWRGGNNCFETSLDGGATWFFTFRNEKEIREMFVDHEIVEIELEKALTK